MTYTVTLPRNPRLQPTASGASGATWDFQLRPTFWFGLTLCDSESAPEYTKTCRPDSDRNDLVGTDPSKPDYIGKHPGNAYMELQFYGPGYVPQFEGFGCTATQYCAAMTIDSFNEDQNTGVPNTSACDNYLLGGLEPINWAYITRSGRSQGPADPLFTGTFANPNLTSVTPDPAQDLMMNPGDRIRIHMHDTPSGFRTDLTDLSTGPHGSMTASTANGFAHVLYTPNATTCQSAPYAFHPEYSHREPAREHVVGAHVQRGDVRRDRALRELPAAGRELQLRGPGRPGRRVRSGPGRRQQLLRPRVGLHPGEDQWMPQRRRRLGRAVLPQRLAGDVPERVPRQAAPPDPGDVLEPARERPHELRADRLRDRPPPDRGPGLPGQAAVLRPEHRRELRQPAGRGAVLPDLHDHAAVRDLPLAGGRPVPAEDDEHLRRDVDGRVRPAAQDGVPDDRVHHDHPLQQLQQDGARALDALDLRWGDDAEALEALERLSACKWRTGPGRAAPVRRGRPSAR